VAADEERTAQSAEGGDEGQAPEDENTTGTSEDEGADGSRTAEGDDDGDESHDPDRARSTIKNLRAREKTLEKENKRLKDADTELKRIRKERKDAERESMGEVERITSERDELQSRVAELEQEVGRYQTTNRRSNFNSTLGRAGLDSKQVRTLWAELDEVGVEPEWEGDNLKNASAIIKAARKYDGEFYGTGDIDQEAKDKSRGRGESFTMNDLFRSGTRR
jgi:chromosome segregation ATPase